MIPIILFLWEKIIKSTSYEMTWEDRQEALLLALLYLTVGKY